MTAIHVLTYDNDKATLVMHFAVPDAVNAVGINFRDALVASNIGRQRTGFDGAWGRRSILESGTGVAQITTTEEALLDSGELFEHVQQVRVPPGASNALLLSQAQAKYAEVNASVQQRIALQLRFFGHTASAT